MSQEQVVADALVANGLEPAPVDGFADALTATAEGDSGSWSVFAQPDEDGRGVVVYSVFPGRAPEGRRLAAAELAARVNYLLRYGSLEMDFADGELRLRTSAAGGDTELPLGVAAELVRVNLQASGLLFPVLGQVLDGASPADAVDALTEALR